MFCANGFPFSTGSWRMTTIILVILGILLAAAAALMVVFYGGDAFNAGSVKAEANTVVNKIQTVGYAVRMHDASTGVPLSARGYATNLQLLKNEGWISTDLIDDIVTVDVDGYGVGNVDHVHLNLGLSEESRLICKEIERQARSKASDEKVALGAGWRIAAAARKTFGCFRYADSGYFAISHI